MGWLNYTDDEVRVFHPAFQTAASEALSVTGIAGTHEWEHHPPQRHGKILPDFVLKDKTSGRWILVVEIKRREDSVFSARNQYQAKSYAEDNESLYPTNAPKYFCLTNLEVTILFALHGTKTPLECQLKDGVLVSGSFRRDSTSAHQTKFVEDLSSICRIVTSGRPVDYETVWPSVLDNLVAHASAVPRSQQLVLSTPATPYWDIVESFFGVPSEQNAARLFLLRCLIAEYLRGALSRGGNPLAGTVPGVRSNPGRVHGSVANTLDKLRTIDFLSVFESSSPNLYRTLNDPLLLSTLDSYVQELVANRVARLAEDRQDALELLDSLFLRFNPLERLPLDGKVQTDPDLAALLATLTIQEPPKLVYDAGCGTGPLLTAAFDRMLELGMNETSAISSVAGLDADDTSARIAALRIALRSPKLLNPSLNIQVRLGDLFCDEALVKSADVIMMNPPFKRYEAQDAKPVPEALRTHYDNSIRRLDGKDPVTTSGQVNLYNYYVEFVVKAARPGTKFGFILDNKWYQSRYGESLREFLLDQCEILAVVDYPHSLYFKSFTIATSIVVLRKKPLVDPDNTVQFVRSKGDPRQSGDAGVAAGMADGGQWPSDWSVRKVLQSELDHKLGWKHYMVDDFEGKFMDMLPPLSSLFRFSRRGSLNKEGGGTGVIDFPFSQSDYGPRRKPTKGGSKGWQTVPDGSLTQQENTNLAEAAGDIPDEFRGWAIRNADDLCGYTLAEEDVTKTETIEPPSLRGFPAFYNRRRTKWTSTHDEALAEMRAEPKVGRFVDMLSGVVGLNEKLLPKDKLWVALREPYAGELIIPRKTRIGHRVHVNPFAFVPKGRQVKISSNFVTYLDCLAVDPSSELGREEATNLIAAYLVSSFGQVQFEREGFNREGVLANEENQLDRIKVLDPRAISRQGRRQILDLFSKLPYPIRSDENSQSDSQKPRNALDAALAGEIGRLSGESPQAITAEVHEILDEWTDARQP